MNMPLSFLPHPASCKVCLGLSRRQLYPRSSLWILVLRTYTELRSYQMVGLNVYELSSFLFLLPQHISKSCPDLPINGTLS